LNHFQLLGLATTLTLSVSAQTIEEGYTSSITTLPGGAQAVYDLPGPGVVYFDGAELVAGIGTNSTTLLSFATPPQFASFTIPVGTESVLFGENSSGEIWLVPLDPASGAPRLLAVVPFNYDAIALSSTHALVSAKTGGFAAPDNDLIAVDLRSGATDTIAVVPGFSGPLTIDSAGDVYYAIGRSPSGADILRFSAARIRGAFGPTQLGEGDATIVHAGLPSAGAIAIDADGDFFVSDFFGPSLIEVSFDPTAATRVTTLADYAGPIPQGGAIRFHDAPDLAAFEPFQPAWGKALSIVETDFYTSPSTVRIRRLRPARATTTVPATVPAGPFALQTTGGPRNGTGVLLLSSNTIHAPTPFALPGFEQPVFFETGAILATATVQFDAAGSLTLNLNNPGFAVPTLFAVQFAFAGTATGAPILGTSRAVAFELVN
jgi:hypothetical protein